MLQIALKKGTGKSNQDFSLQAPTSRDLEILKDP